MPLVSIALRVAAAPVTALLVMIVTGLTSFWPGVATILLILVSCALFGLVWARDLDVLAEAVRRIEAGDAETESVGQGLMTPPAPMKPPTSIKRPALMPPPILMKPLALMEPLGLELARLSRSLAARESRVREARRADTLILESLPDPLLVLRADRGISRQNPATAAVLGADLAAVLRHPVLRETLDLARLKGETARADLFLAGPVERDLLATVVPMNPPLADGGHAVVVLSDRTREHSAERSRTDFVANVSHELRTPLASLIGFTSRARRARTSAGSSGSSRPRWRGCSA